MPFKNSINTPVKEDLIGRDLFTEALLFDPKTGAPSSTSDDPKPKFCVVGANGFSIGKWGRFKDSPTSNETSILCILFWPGTKSSPARCSYFTGGDGHPTVERKAVMPFLKDTL